jgi:coenzyme F420 hydrogenase subunit beta
MKFSKNKRKSIQIIVDCKICCGCGACTVICPASCIEFIYGERYNYPKIDTESCINCGKCFEVCPSAFLLKGTDPGFLDEPAKESYDCYLVHSKDDGIRLDASSGGFITGLVLHLMNSGLADGGIVARCEGNHPLVAESFVATDRESLLSARASKYTPVSSCTVLADVLKRPGRYVFVGTPCMIEGLTKLQGLIPILRERIVLTIGLVCAGMASRLSTKNYLERYGINPADVRRINYRGNGWPGSFRVYGDNGVILERPLLGDELKYLVGWDHYLRCWNCLDHWGRFADIVVSDPWTDEMVRTERKGRSAVMVRTKRGREVVASAIDSGDIIADSITVKDMLGYNRHLVVDSKHTRYGWMSLYQLIFFGRMKKPIAILRNLLRKRGVGLMSTLRARFNNEYYEREKHSK